MDSSNQTFIAADVPLTFASAAFAVSEMSPVTLGITTFVTAIVSFLAYQLYRPSVDPRSPAFTSDTSPILGSFGFVVRQW